MTENRNNAESIAHSLSGDMAIRTGASSWMAKCPSHEDTSPSLHIIGEGKDSVKLSCMAGCSSIMIEHAMNTKEEERALFA